MNEISPYELDQRFKREPDSNTRQAILYVRRNTLVNLPPVE
jgi:hypothetical protein